VPFLYFYCGYSYGTNYISYITNYYYEFNFAILFMDAKRANLPFFNEKFGVYYTIHILNGSIKIDGNKMHTPATIFQS
jgi:hypothetical protein